MYSGTTGGGIGRSAICHKPQSCATISGSYPMVARRSAHSMSLASGIRAQRSGSRSNPDPAEIETIGDPSRPEP